jgi:uncharacterized protein YqeY
VILDDLKKKLVEYMKSGDSEKLRVLRFFLSQVAYKEIELRPSKQELTDELVYKVLKKLVKDRKELIEIYNSTGKADKAQAEVKELEILREFAKFFPFELDTPPVQYQRPVK